jgi:hypothetical protein
MLPRSLFNRSDSPFEEPVPRQREGQGDVFFKFYTPLKGGIKIVALVSFIFYLLSYNIPLAPLKGGIKIAALGS